jgi:hypothetical protein
LLVNQREKGIYGVAEGDQLLTMLLERKQTKTLEAHCLLCYSAFGPDSILSGLQE